MDFYGQVRASQIPTVNIPNLPVGIPTGPYQTFEPQTQSLQPQASILDQLKSIDLNSPIVKYVGVGVALFIIFRMIRR